MSERKPQRQHGAPIWGVILLFLGIVFLLQVLDVVPWGLWWTLWRLWPVLIIVIGLNILLSRGNLLLVSALVFALLWASFGIAYWQYDQPSGSVTKSYSEALNGLESARIEIDFDGGSLSLGGLTQGSSNLVEVEAEASYSERGIRADFHREDNKGELSLSTEGAKRVFWSGPWVSWEMRFTGDIPLEIELQSAASNLNLDLSQLLITEFMLDMDAGSCKVTAPSPTGMTYIEINADVCNVDLTIPDGVAARIRADTELSDVEIDEGRFSRDGDYHVSEDFANSENRLEIKIKCNVGRVQVR